MDLPSENLHIVFMEKKMEDTCRSCLTLSVINDDSESILRKL